MKDYTSLYDLRKNPENLTKVLEAESIGRIAAVEKFGQSWYPTMVVERILGIKQENSSDKKESTLPSCFVINDCHMQHPIEHSSLKELVLALDNFNIHDDDDDDDEFPVEYDDDDDDDIDDDYDDDDGYEPMIRDDSDMIL